MSLPLPWVDKIFSKLTLVHGRDFIGRWEGLDLADVKTDWAHELAGFDNFPEGIAFALTNLPVGKPPTVLEFRAMALKAPRPAAPQLELPRPDMARVSEGLKRAIAAAQKPATNGVDNKAWAKEIIRRKADGERVPPTCLRFAHEALRLPMPVRVR